MGLLLRGGERGGRRREWEEKGMGEKRKGTKSCSSVEAVDEGILYRGFVHLILQRVTA